MGNKDKSRLKKIMQIFRKDTLYKRHTLNPAAFRLI